MASYPPASPPPYQAPMQNSNTALLSLIAGIAGLTIFPGVGSIIAVILGLSFAGLCTLPFLIPSNSNFGSWLPILLAA